MKDHIDITQLILQLPPGAVDFANARARLIIENPECSRLSLEVASIIGLYGAITEKILPKEGDMLPQMRRLIALAVLTALLQQFLQKGSPPEKGPASEPTRVPDMG